VFVPIDAEFPDVVCTYIDTAFKTGQAYVRLHFDFGVTDEVILPVKSLFPLDVWRRNEDCIPKKGSFSTKVMELEREAADEPVTIGEVLDSMEIEGPFDSLDGPDEMLGICQRLGDDDSLRAETYWNAIMDAEADGNEVLANALVLAYEANMDISEWMNDKGEIEAPESMICAIRATVLPSRELIALPSGQTVDVDDVIDVQERETV
jgi:hypothetical protein